MEKITYLDDAMDRRIAELERELSTLRQSAPTVTLSDLLQLFYDSNLIPLSRSTITGKILDCNQAYCDMLGYTREELLSGEITWMQLTPPEYAQREQDACREVLETGRARPYEKEYLRKDGTRVSVMIAVTATDLSGEDVLGIFINLSEIRQSELELRKSEEQFRFLVDHIPQIVYICSEDGLTAEYFNRRLTDYTGREPQEAMYENWRNLIHPEDMQMVMESWERTHATGEPTEMELRHMHKDGTYHWGLIRSVAMKLADGTIAKWIGTCTNIDEQKQVEFELREREEYFRLLAHAMPQIVWTASADGKIDFFNDRWLEYTGLSVEQSLSGGWQLLIHPSDLDEYLSKWKNAVETGETYEHEFRLKRAVGLSKNQNGYLWQLCRAVALRNRNGRIVQWFGTWTEIDEQKKKPQH